MTKKERKEYMRKWNADNRKKVKKYRMEYCIKNREEISEQKREYRSANREKINKYNRKWCAANRMKVREHSKEYMRKRNTEIPWETHYYNAKKRCTDPNHISFQWYGKRGIKFLLAMEGVKYLYERDNAGYMKKPSIDRIDSDGDYVLSNCRFIEAVENSRQGAIRGLVGVVAAV